MMVRIVEFEWADAISGWKKGTEAAPLGRVVVRKTVERGVGDGERMDDETKVAMVTSRRHR